MSELNKHETAVDAVSADVRRFYAQKEKFRISHGSTNSTRLFKRGNTVDISSLNHILEINVHEQTCLVEPNVPMDRLVEKTLEYGLIPPVVMEFPGITVGGGYAGTSGESSSFKHGFFNTNINWVEMVLADGQIVKCSNDEKADLFHGAAGAVGSLGITTLLELRLIKATAFVQTTYHPVASIKEAIDKIGFFASDFQYDYVDGILFSPSSGVIITGKMTDRVDPSVKIQHFSDPWDPWFFMHAQDKIKNMKTPLVEAVPLAEYLFRYDRGGFWVGVHAFDYFKVSFNKYWRWYLDDFLHTRMMYTALHASEQAKMMIIQDLALPYSSAEEFIRYTTETVNIWPLWLCPLRQSPRPTFHPHMNQEKGDGKTDQPMLNIGLWGHTPRQADFVQLNRDLEAALRELGGMKWLYAQSFYTEEEFWSIYDRRWYEALREKYNATSLPSVYEKVKTDVKSNNDGSFFSHFIQIWPIGGLYGLWQAIQTGTYHQARKASWRWQGVQGHLSDT